jgi:diguanylate cyclase (GGDEF)-like protein
MRGEDNQIIGVLGIYTDITSRKQAEQQIHNLAYFDPLTSLPNRTLLLDRLRQAMTTSNRSGNHGALLFIDLDNFKTLNDTLGHDMGDMLLRQVAQRLQACVRAEDTVARVGGDEFLVMLTNLGAHEREVASQVEIVGRKILTALNQTYQLNDVVFNSTSSIAAARISIRSSDLRRSWPASGAAMVKFE